MTASGISASAIVLNYEGRGYVEEAVASLSRLLESDFEGKI